MCGILALWDRSGAIDPALVARMSALIQHRGPDDEGYLFADTRTRARRAYWGPDAPEDVRRTPTPFAPEADVAEARLADAAGPGTAADLALMGRRLAIIDLTPTGHQPLATLEGDLWIVYNGEVYNYLELRAELASKGHVFAGTCDTEVILHAYREWGEECVTRMNGMWGLAIWDVRERRLFLARDRLGVKPLYVTTVDGLVAAASEITPLLALRRARGLSPEPDWHTIRRFLDPVLIDAGEDTFFAGIRRLPPAHTLTIAAERSSQRRYWDIPPRAPLSVSPERAAEEFRTLFDDSVRLRLRSDVAVGTCLSGGLDSSSVVASAAPRLPRGMYSFSVAYDEGGPFDERRYMRAVAERYGLEARITVPDGADLFAELPAIVRHQEEPGGGEGLYSQWRVMRLAHEARIKVLLDGQGGDEILAGYVNYLFHHLNDLLERGQLLAWARLLADVTRRHRLGVLHTVARALDSVIPRPLFALGSRRLGAGRALVLGSRLRALARDPLPPLPRRFPDRLTQQQFADVVYFLPSLLRYEDRNSMAHSIEARLPFLDYRLVELVFRLPAEAKVRHGVPKAVLRDAVGDRLPPEVQARRDKVGFATPTDAWLRGRFRGQLEAVLLAPRTAERGVFDMPVLRDRLAAFFAGRALPYQVWRWLHLELWFRMFIDGEGAPA